MEKQGVCGPKARFLTGNLNEISSFVSKATSQDMKTINHDIVGRLLPHFVAWSNQYGKIMYVKFHDFFMYVPFCLFVI
jgi:cytokinin trans-hydroxylase